MWKCERCGQEIDDQVDECLKCAEPSVSAERAWRLNYRLFRGSRTSWESLFEQAAEFASQRGRDRVLSISHAEHGDDGVVTVWYWARVTEKPPPGS